MYVIVSSTGDMVSDPNNDEIEKFEEIEDTAVTLEALKTSLPFLNFEAIKVTIVDYCGECHNDFEKNSIVHYAYIENNCFCSKCKEKLNIRDWDLRFFIGKG